MLASCFCGSARVHVLYCVLHALRRHQASKLLLWECPHSCFVLCFTSGEAISRQRLVSVAVPSLRFCIVFYTHRANISLATCLCGSAHVHILHCVLHVLKQYQASKLLLWECPCSCFTLCFTRSEATSGWRIASVTVPSIMFCIVFETH